MAITVNCPNCRASFKVDDKYAGRQGPCPKCKSPITIPKVEKVVIHEENATATTAAAAAGGPKAKSATQAIRPIARTEVQFRIVPALLIVAAIVAMFVLTYFLRSLFEQHATLRGLGLFLVGLPAAIGAYSILRNDELEPYQGGSLWWRTAVCSLVYTSLWIGFFFLPVDIKHDLFNWAIFVPVVVIIGGATSMVLYDLDFFNGAFHYVLFLAGTIVLGYVAGLGWPWAVATSP